MHSSWGGFARGRIGEGEIFGQLSRIGVCRDAGAFQQVKESTRE
jgi:hypothetical protein